MTEDEARQKWCPFARVAYPESISGCNVINRLYNTPSPGPCRCIASGCMVWRWEIRNVEPPEGEILLPEKSDEEGYCGLAGGHGD